MNEYLVLSSVLRMVDSPCLEELPVRGRDKEMGSMSNLNSAKIDLEHKVLKKHFSLYLYCELRAFTLHSLSNAAITSSITVSK